MQLSKKAMIVGVIDAFIALTLLRNFRGYSSDYEGDYISNFEPMAGMRTVVRYPHHYSSPMLRTKSGLLDYEDTLEDYRAVISDTLQRMPNTRNRTEQPGITTMMFHINPNEVEQQTFYEGAAPNLTASLQDSNYPPSNNSESFHWEDFLNNRDTPSPSVQSSPASTSSDKSDNSGTLSDTTTTSARVDNQESESDVSEQHNVDLAEQMYKQDIDIGFHWQHLSPELQNQKTLNHNFNKDENIDDYVIDGETGEQEFKSLPNLDLGGNLPGVLSKPDDFDIDEYLELLENADLINLEQPLDEMVRKEEPVLDNGENILPLGATADNNNLPPTNQVFQNRAAAPAWVENNVNNGGYGNYEELNFFPTFTSNHQQPNVPTTHNNQQPNSISQAPAMFDTMAKTNYPPHQSQMQQQSQMMGQSEEIFVPINDQNYLLDVIEMQPPNNDSSNMYNNNAAAFNTQTYPQQQHGGIVQQQQQNFLPQPPQQQQLNHNMHAAPSYPMETDQQSMNISTSTESPGQIFFDLDKDVNMSNNMDVGTNDMFMDTCMFPPPPMDTNQVVNNPRPPLPPVSTTDTIDSIPFLEDLSSFDANVEVKPDPDMGTTQARETVVVVKEEVLDPKLIRDLKNFEHNHTYDGTNGIRKPIRKTDLSGSRKSRDERKAEELGIPFTLDEIVFTPVDDFNEMLSRVTLSSEQQLLIKDIRRRGKNKIAAQNCRKRKVETINHMEEDVDLLRKKKEELIREQNLLTKQKLQIQKNYDLLRNKVLTSISSQAAQSSSSSNSGYDIFVMNDTMSGIVHPMSSSPGSSSSSSSSSMRSLTESPPPGPFHHPKFPNHPHNQFHVKHEKNETTF